MGHLDDTPEHTSLVKFLLVQADRGLEPRPKEGGYPGGVGSQWCNRLPHDLQGGCARMKRIVFMVTVALVMALMMALAGPAFATIHPIVESADCVGTDVPEGHPTGDVADPPGQTPGFGSHSDQSDLRGFSEADDSAAFGHKLDGKCGKVGQS